MPERESKVRSIIVVGAGYTGQRLLKALAGKTNRLIALSRSNLKSAHSYETVKLDLDSAESVRIDAEQSLICYLVPPATDGDPKARLRKFVDEVLIRAPVRFLLISTTGVYGDCRGDWVSEDRVLNPQTERAKRRVQVENYCSEWAKDKGVSLAIFRVAGIYGPDRIPLERVRRGFSIPKNLPDGFSNRIHVDDLVTACVAGLFKSGTGVFNVSDGHPLRYREYFNLVAEICGVPSVVERNDGEIENAVSPAMRSYLRESRKIANTRLLETFSIELVYPHAREGVRACFDQCVNQ